MATNRLRAAPVTNKGTERVIAILEAAKDVLVEEGFAALSLREVAKRADMTVGNVGYYFPSKDSLLAALAEHIFDRWDARLRRHAPPDLAGGLPTFVYSIRFMIEENKRPKTKSLLLEMWAMANRSRAIRLMMDTFYGRMRGWIEAMLLDIDPAMSRHTCRLRAALVTAQIEGLMLLIGPASPAEGELIGLEEEAIKQIQRVALAP